MSGAPRAVLLVEDEHDLRLTLEELLGEEGLPVMAAAHGALALEWLRVGGRPSLVLLDFSMPRLNGWAFLERLQALTTLRDVPVVALSGSEVHHPALAATLRKPFNVHQVVGLVRRLVLPP